MREWGNVWWYQKWEDLFAKSFDIELTKDMGWMNHLYLLSCSRRWMIWGTVCICLRVSVFTLFSFWYLSIAAFSNACNWFFLSFLSALIFSSTSFFSSSFSSFTSWLSVYSSAECSLMKYSSTDEWTTCCENSVSRRYSFGLCLRVMNSPWPAYDTWGQMPIPSSYNMLYSLLLRFGSIKKPPTITSYFMPCYNTSFTSIFMNFNSPALMFILFFISRHFWMHSS